MKRLVACAIGLFFLVACNASQDSDPGPWDLLIRGGTIVDGTGGPGFTGDVAVRDARIVRIAREALPEEEAARVVDATGLVVAPGFVDIHAHLDPILDIPDAESHVRQGVTTALGNPDGGGPHRIAAHLDTLRAVGVGLNVAFLVGHNTVRREVMGMDDRGPTAEELEAMESLIETAMEEGAFGISTGLRYTPGVYSDLDEVVALSRVAARYGGFYTSHLRDEGMELIEGVDEAIEIGRRAEIPVVLTHHKVVGAPMWGASERTLAMIDSARAEGVDVMADQYPYTATHTGISILVPPWALAGGDEEFLERLDDPVLHDSIMRGIEWNIVNDRGGNDLRRVQFSGVTWDSSLEGGTLYDWAEREGMDPTPETGARLVIEAMRQGGARTIFHALHEDDVERIMQHPMTAIASDGRLVRPGDGHPHPRWYGTFPRVLGHYVRERGVLELEEAVRKMTSLPADRAGFEGRGRIEEGAWADLALFDPDEVIDRATFQDPHNYPDGIPYVIVNGVVTVDGGEFLDLRPGRVLVR